MTKVTLDLEDGSAVQDFFDQAHVDAAVKTAVDAIVPHPVVAPETQEVDLIQTDGTTQKFTRAA